MIKRRHITNGRSVLSISCITIFIILVYYQYNTSTLAQDIPITALTSVTEETRMVSAGFRIKHDLTKITISNSTIN